MEKESKQSSRKTFISWGLGLMAVLAVPPFVRPRKKTETTRKVKMLTEDGHLVWIDVANIPEKKKRIAAKDIHTWINKKKISF